MFFCLHKRVLPRKPFLVVTGGYCDLVSFCSLNLLNISLLPSFFVLPKMDEGQKRDKTTEK